MFKCAVLKSVNVGNCIKTSDVLFKGNVCRIYVNRRLAYSNRAKAPNLRVRSKEITPTSILLLSIPISTFGLGVWQIERKKWKEDLIDKLMVKTKIPPVPLPDSDEEIKDLEYRAVTVNGVFDHANELYLGPRSCLVDGDSNTNQGRLISSKADGVSGYLVVTPLELSDTKEKILVNRGWVPFKNKKPETRARGQVEGEVTITGIVRHTEPRPQFSPMNKPDSRVWFSRDIETMAETVKSRPVFIDATADSTVYEGPIGGQTRSSLRNEHMSYIITWFSLSAATAVMWYFRFIR